MNPGELWDIAAWVKQKRGSNEATATVAAVSHTAAVWKSLESEVCVALNQVRKIMNWVIFSPEVPPT